MNIIITRKARLVWENPYVTDGLIAMWDGEWNAGGGVHAQNAIKWRNIAQTEGDSDLNIGTNTSWGTTFLNLPPMGQYGASTNIGSSRFIHLLRSAIESNRAFTMETVVGLDEWVENPYKTDLWGKSRYGIINTSFVGYWAFGIHDSNVYSFNTNGDSGTSYWWCSAHVANKTVVGNQGLAVVIRPFGEYRISVDYYKNGVKLPVDSAFYPTSAISDESAIAGLRNIAYDSWNVGGTRYNLASADRQYSYRVYSRALSEEEIMANYAIDQARFRLP